MTPSPTSLPSVAKFAAAAAALGFIPEIVFTPQPARTAEQAALACGCTVAEIVKSLIFRGEVSGEPLLFLVSGSNRVDEARAAAAGGEPIARPDAAFVRAATGFAIGGIPPFGHDRPTRTFMDRDLLAHGRLWAAAGHPNAVFAIAPDMLRILARATPVTT